jgi:hypothetical protein
MKNCKGKNCAIAGENMHSLECMFEHFLSYTGEDIDADNALIAKLRKAYFDGAATTESELEALKRERAMLVEALKFYAYGSHFIQHQEVWESVSGEPENFLEDENNTATVEDGSVAKQALSATEQQSQQWLAEHDAEVIESFGDRYSCVFYEVTNISKYVGPAIKQLAHKDAAELRLAASKRKEQV